MSHREGRLAAPASCQSRCYWHLASCDTVTSPGTQSGPRLSLQTAQVDSKASGEASLGLAARQPPSVQLVLVVLAVGTCTYLIFAQSEKKFQMLG